MSNESEENEVHKLKKEMLIKDLLLASGSEGIGISENGKIIFANDQLAHMLGHNNADEMIGEPVSNYVASRSVQYVMDNIAKGISEPYESFSRRIDGSEFPSLTFARQTEFNGKKVRITTIRDISKYYDSRAQFESSELRYKSLFNQIPITVWNEDASELLVYAKEMGLGKIENLQEYLAENLDIVSQGLSKLKITDVNANALELLDVQNKDMIINSFSNFFTERTLQTFSKSMTAIIKRKPSFEGESEILTASGKIIDIHIYWRLLPIDEGDYSKIVTVITDITVRKRSEAERRRMESRFEQMQKQESLGIFAGG
ncbi:MAG: PAS domain-containing protein, partial [Candidatus Heimdallarchaeota archaeon]|nr:PAS domain-containing protein [Candidatus Heimdallarchaeota archaeon]